ncbi:MAG: hypothetical protein ACTSQI_00655 [Candidatus Helarchaeota archaeon]
MPYLWLHVAKNELKIWTSRFRNHRKLLFIIIAGILGTYAFILVPLILNPFSTEIFNALSKFGPSLPFLMYYIISFIVLYIFLWCLTYPMSMTLQSTSDLSGQLEILLGTPLKTHDLLFGKFIGRLPIYSILLFGFAPWIVNVFKIIAPINILGQIFIYLILYLVIILSMWLGNLIAAYTESIVRKSERSRDLGKAMTFLITIFTVSISYVLMWVVFSGLSDPTSSLYSVLKFFPSTWGSILIINIFGYGGILGANIYLYSLLLIGVTIGVLYFGYHLAGTFYSLEPIEKATPQIFEEKRFYRWFRKVIPSNFGIMFVTQLKQYSRKLENFSRIAYAVGISITVMVFNVAMGAGEGVGGEINPFIINFIAFFFPMMLSGMLGCYVIIGSKDNLWIYKKAPNGVKNYVKSIYLVNIIYTLLIAILFSIIATLVLRFNLIQVLSITGLTIAFILILMAMAIGIAFIFPTFEERGSKVGLLMMTFMGLSIGAWIGGLFLGIFLLGDVWYAGPLLTLCITTAFGYILLKVGIKKLSGLE